MTHQKFIRKDIPVLGMSCASCANSIESTVKNTTGVSYSNVNFANNTLSVEYSPEIVSLEQLKIRVQQAGFDLLIENNDSQIDTLEEIQSSKILALKKKAIWSAIFTFPVFLLGMFFMDFPYANEIMWILTTPVVFWLGSQFYINAFKQAKHKKANMDTLVALGTGIAYIFSVFNLFFPDFWHNRGIHAHVYFEASAVIITFILLGKWLEEKAKGSTTASIKKLMKLQAKTVTILTNKNQEISVDINLIEPGQTVVIKPGERIPVDGTVISGSTYIDESMLTGEPIPTLKEEKSRVFAGTLNQKGSILVLASKIGKETYLAHIIQAVQDAQGQKAPIQKQVDKIAAVFVPIVLIIAVITFILWLLLGGENSFAHAMLSAVSVLVIACPCALGLATPTALMVGLGVGAENGILIKGAESVEQAKHIDTIVLDKTGTITEGKPNVENLVWEDDVDIKKMSSIFSVIEQKSEHPLAEAITSYLGKTENTEFSNFESITGKGVVATIQNEKYFVGNLQLITEHNILLTEKLGIQLEVWKKEGKTIAIFANSKNALAIVAISDQVKQTSKKAIQAFANLGIEVHMFTGDNNESAATIAQQVGIKNIQANLLPEDKARLIQQLQNKGKVVAMVGDGINDSTALATADVSIAMGQGSEIAMDVAQMTITSSDLNKIPKAIQLSKKTVRTIHQNLFWAFIYNLIGIPIAAGILYPFNGFTLNPMIAGAAMAFSSVSVVANSILLKFKSI